LILIERINSMVGRGSESGDDGVLNCAIAKALPLNSIPLGNAPLIAASIIAGVAASMLCVH